CHIDVERAEVPQGRQEVQDPRLLHATRSRLSPCASGVPALSRARERAPLDQARKSADLRASVAPSANLERELSIATETIGERVPRLRSLCLAGHQREPRWAPRTLTDPGESCLVEPSEHDGDAGAREAAALDWR